MGHGPARSAFNGMRTAYLSGSVAGLTDAQLLDRFIRRAGDDGASFEALLARHGPMVLGVCRALLRDEHAADDAFQATFLVLVRRAGSVRVGDSLGRWLYGVARKVAVRSRRDAATRNSRERVMDGASLEPSRDGSDGDVEAADLRAAVHEELARLPESARTAIVLCHLEGLTHEEAATRLGWPVGTVRSRLARGRDRLRERLARRGLAPTPIVPVLGFEMSPMVPDRLIAATRLAAAKLAAGQALSAGIVPASVFTLTSGVLHAMFFTKLKIAALVIGSAGLLSFSGVYAYQAGQKGNGEGAAPGAEAPPAAAPDDPAAPKANQRSAAELLAEDWKRAMDRVAWVEQMYSKGYVAKAAVLKDIEQAKALNKRAADQLDQMERDLERPRAAKPESSAPKAEAPSIPAASSAPVRQIGAQASTQPRRSEASSASDPSADELAIQLEAAIAKRQRVRQLHQQAAVSTDILEIANLEPMALAARIETRMEQLRDELAQLQAQLKVRQAFVNKAKAQIEVAAVVVARNERLGKRIPGAVSEEESAKTKAEMLLADSEFQIRVAEIGETEVLIRQLQKRIEQLAPVSKMARETLGRTGEKAESPPVKLDPPPPPAGRQ